MIVRSRQSAVQRLNTKGIYDLTAVPTRLPCGNRVLDLSRTHVMGILNITPDSFSDGGRFNQRDEALRHAEAMVAAGATLIDIGGESTRPGARAVSPTEELERVAPMVEAINSRLDVIISVDTSTPAVMRESARLGAGLINDVRALERDGALDAAADTGLPVCLMHMRGEPGTMQDNPHYDDVSADVTRYLEERMAACAVAGLPLTESSSIRVLALPRRSITTSASSNTWKCSIAWAGRCWSVSRARA